MSNSGPMCVFAVDNFCSGSSGAFAEDGNEYLDTIEVGKLLTQNFFKKVNTPWYYL
jgi:hypothetical protein